MKDCKAQPSISIEQYIELRGRLEELGYGDEIEWSRSVPQISDPLLFWSEYAWVVLNSGMRNRSLPESGRKFVHACLKVEAPVMCSATRENRQASTTCMRTANASWRNTLPPKRRSSGYASCLGSATSQNGTWPRTSGTTVQNQIGILFASLDLKASMDFATGCRSKAAIVLRRWTWSFGELPTLASCDVLERGWALTRNHEEISPSLEPPQLRCNLPLSASNAPASIFLVRSTTRSGGRP